MYVKEEDAAGRDESKLRVIEVVPDRITSHDFGPEAGGFARLYFALWRRVHPTRP
jgi:hypothetical protein